MKKVIVAIVLVLALGGYWWWSSRSGSSTTVADSTAPTTSVSSGTPNPSTSSTTTTVTATITTPTAGQYKDGTYTGVAGSSVYGAITVAAVVSGGRLTDVKFLTYPQSPEHSLQVSNDALPQLKTEAITSQNAQVNIVSGATQTSEAFRQSLASALAQAQS